MKVLHLGLYYHPSRGGIETVMRSLCAGLARRVNVHAVVNQKFGMEQTDHLEGVEVTRLTTWFKLAGTPIGPGMGRAISNRAADIIHLHHPYPTATLSLLRMRVSARLVCSWHSDIVKRRAMAALFEPFLRRFLDRCSRIHVASPRHCESSRILRRYRHKCVVVPYGIELRDYVSSPPECIRAVRERFGPRIVLAVGRLVYYKGFEYLVDAMRKLDASCLIVGDGPWRQKLQEQIGRFGLGKKVFLLGLVEDVRPFYEACDVFVLPSVEASEAFGMVQLEAMAYAKPVVNTALRTAVPWVSLDRETGLTVPVRDANALADAIGKLLHNRELRETYGRNARARVERLFSVDQMVEGMLSLYREVLATAA